MKTKEEIAQYKKDWAFKHKDEIKVRLKNWYLNNKDKIKAYRIKNRERILQQKRESYQRNKETYKLYWKTPKARHQAKIQKYKNRSILKSLKHHSNKEWLDLLKQYDGKCVDCGTKEKIEKDHVIPLSKGGNDLIKNILPRCRICNARKGNKVIHTPVTY